MKINCIHSLKINLIFLLVFPLQLVAQNGGEKSTGNIKSELLYGVVTTPRFYKDDHPFLVDGQFNNFQIHYKDYIYDSMRLRYNLNKQSLVYYQDISETVPRFIQLNPNYVNEFTTNVNNRTVHFKSGNHYNYPDSRIIFYEVKHENHLSYIVGYIKDMTETFTLNQVNYKFNKREKHYVVVDGEAHRIRRSRDIYNLFEEKKKELKKYRRKNGLKLRTKYPRDIVELLKYYEQITYN